MRTRTGLLGLALVLLPILPLAAEAPAVGPSLAVPRAAGRIYVMDWRSA